MALGTPPSSAPGWGFADPQLARARLLIAAGDLAAAEAALEAARCGPAAAVQAGFARLRLAADDPYGALAALEGVRPDLSETRVELRLQEALAFTALGRPDAGTSFEAALAAAETTGVRSILLEAHEQLRPLLLDAIRHGTAHRALVGELLDALDDREPVIVLEDANLNLTDRELAVIRFLTSTLSNREIASELLISTNTVKTHVRSIYRKLGVPDRRGAVERARALGLLSQRRPPASARVVETLDV